MDGIKHLIAGEWLDGKSTFRSDPCQGMGEEYAQGNESDVDLAVQHAAAAFASYCQTDARTRSTLLNLIAAQIEADRSGILDICAAETGLVADRLAGEFTRTVNQLKYFANLILDHGYLDSRHEPAMPERAPLPRPELRMIQRPVGPVGVFGASNFPLAFSTAGGDTAAALAAGCPVVVKAHSAHPGTSDRVARCIDSAIKQTSIHAGVFSQVQSNTFVAGQALVQHPLIKAVGFTGSTSGGRYLFNLCAAREEPIPFYGELGSINPVFILSGALKNDVVKLAKNWIASLTFGAGQLCTNPGMLIMSASEETELFIQATKDELNNHADQVLLTDGIAKAYRQGHEKIRNCPETTVIRQAECQRRRVTPSVYRTTARAWMNNEFLSEEVFGPLGQIVLAESTEEVLQLAQSLKGQLTCTLHMQESDISLARQLFAIVEHKAGRVIVNGFPTGVEVSDAMVHGGPYPASTNFGASSVGSISIRRFLRPVCYQGVPESLLANVPGF